MKDTLARCAPVGRLLAALDHLSDPGRQRKSERGQSVVILALTMAVLAGLMGLAFEGGRDMVDRRALQSAADTATDSALRMLLADYHAEVAGQSDPFPAAPTAGKVDIKTKVDSLMAGSRTAQSGLTSYTALYVDSTGTSNLGKTVQGGDFGVLCKAPGQVACTAGVRVLPRFDHAVTAGFQAALGATTASEAARSTDVYQITGPVPEPFSFWSIWNYDCPNGGAPIVVGSDVIFHQTNGWEKHSPQGPGACGDPAPGPSGNASYKGFLGSTVMNCDGSVAVVVSVGSCLQTTNGNATKPGDIPLLHSKTYMFPIFNIDVGGQLFVSGFAAVQPDSDGGDSGTVKYFCAPPSDSTICIPPLGAPIKVTSGFLQ